MIVHELEKLALARAISHWDVWKEEREVPGGAVTIDVYRVFLRTWNEQVASELCDAFRKLQNPMSPHHPMLVEGTDPYISVPLG